MLVLLLSNLNPNLLEAEHKAQAPSREVEPVVVPQGKAGPDTLLLLTWAPDTAYPKVWISYDGGITWTFRAYVDTLSSDTGDYTAAIAHDVNTHYLYAFLWGTDLNLTVYFSQDTGKTWVPVDTITGAGLGSGEPILSADVAPDGRVFLVSWTEDSFPKVWESSDYGQTWSFVGYIPYDTGSSSAEEDVVGLIALQDGLVAVLSSEHGLDLDSLLCFVSFDWGQTWERRGEVDPTLRMFISDPAADLAADSLGNLWVAVWGAEDDWSTQTVRVYSSSDGGWTWNEVQTFNAAYGSSWMNNYLSYAISSSGYHYIAFWRDNTGDDPWNGPWKPIVHYRDLSGSWFFADTVRGEVLYDGGNRPPVGLCVFHEPKPFLISEGAASQPQPALRFDGENVLLNLPAGTPATLKLYSADGRLVRTLLRGAVGGPTRVSLGNFKGVGFLLLETEGKRYGLTIVK